ncbi:uncharacterized protein [Periplaneta americana]|uniref:uncharacterized protein isoform X5 n=1 Tax=Periplaneta americana TaxID=6978 RepID=UPI0037E952A9
MEVIKKEPEVDPLAVHWSDNTDTDEKKPLSEDGLLLDPYVAGIKMKCEDNNCDLTSDIKVEETAVPTNFVTINCKDEVDVPSPKPHLHIQTTLLARKSTGQRVYPDMKL